MNPPTPRSPKTNTHNTPTPPHHHTPPFVKLQVEKSKHVLIVRIGETFGPLGTDRKRGLMMACTITRVPNDGVEGLRRQFVHAGPSQCLTVPGGRQRPKSLSELRVVPT